jgi:hypothetical protein
VDGLLESLTASQLLRWQEFADLEPFGPQAEEWRFGVLVALLAAANGVKGAEPGTYFPSLKGDAEMTPEQLVDVAMMMAGRV